MQSPEFLSGICIWWQKDAERSPLLLNPMTLPNPDRLFSWLMPGLLISVTPVLPGSLASPLPVLAQSSTNSAVKAEADRLLQHWMPSEVKLPRQIAQASDARRAEAYRLYMQGLYQDDLSNEAKLRSLHQALAIYQQSKDLEGMKGVLSALSVAAHSLKDYRKEVDYQQQLLSITRELKDQSGEMLALSNLGTTYYKLEEYQKAINSEYQRLNIARALKNHSSEISSLQNLGDIYYRIGEYNKAIDYLQQSLAIIPALKVKDPRWTQGYSRQSLGGIENSYRALGDYLNTMKYREQRLAIEKSMTYGISNSDLNTTHTDQRNIRSGDRKSDADRLLEKGKATENAEAKIAILQQALEIYRQIKDREGEQDGLLELGNAYASMSLQHLQDNLGLEQAQLNYRKAIDYQQQSLTIARDLKKPYSIDYILDNLGGTYSQLSIISYASGDYSTAVEAQQKYLEILQDQKVSVFIGGALHHLGEIYYRLGEYSKAIDYVQQSLVIARALQHRDGERASLSILGSIYLTLGNFDQAIDCQQKSLVIARELKIRGGEGIALNELGVALESTGKLADAENSFREAISIWEEQRKETQNGAFTGDGDGSKVDLFESQSTTYRSLQRVLVAQNKLAAALEIAEQGRARALVDLLAFRTQKQGGSFKVLPPISLAEIKEIAKDQNATLVTYSLIDNASGAFHDFGVRLAKQPLHTSTIYVWAVQPTGTVTFRKVDLNSLKQQNTSLDQLVASARCLGIVGCESKVASSRSSKGGVGVYSPSQSDRLEANAQQQSDQNPYLQQLNKLLIAPIADLLPTDPNAHVIFMPQGSLFLVPFAALQDAQGKYLIEQHTIITAPSIQVLESTQKLRQQVQQAGRQQALVVGNPKMPLQLRQLPGAQIEAEAIAPLFHTQPILGAQATKAAIVQQMPNARWIHLATHGILDDQQGLGSAIALAPNGTGETNDGLLTADEIFNLKLNAELVVLSACDTGQGRITGDGVLGLSRSLITAGVPSVLVSLWAVDDNSTSQLMQQFYTNLFTGKMGKAAALRQAQIAMIRGKQQNQSTDRSSVVFPTGPGEGKASISHDLSNPYYWAPFILIGNGL
jgi:CHAT domain-containing protein/tetratricopeptide (TPR) repeat protein